MTDFSDEMSVPALATTDKIAGLLPADFQAAEGYHADAAGIELFVIAQETNQADTVDLEIRFVPNRWDGGRRSPSPEVNSTAAAALRYDLHHDEAQMRAAACQALGQFGDRSAVIELFKLAAEDPEPFVQQTARQAIERIGSPAIELHAFRSVELVLSYGGCAGASIALGPQQADELGVAHFRAVPRSGVCRLELVPRPIQAHARDDIAELGDLLNGLCFGHDEPVGKQSGLNSVAVRPYPTDSPAKFSALLQVRSAGASRRRLLPGIAVSRGSEFWAPSVACPATGQFWFHKLPCGEFVTCLSHDWLNKAPRRSSLFAATEFMPGQSPIGESYPRSQIIHPPDHRLTAIIEADSRGRVVMTVETQAPELEHARVRYLLGSQHGELGFAEAKGRVAWQTSLRLDQPYRGDEAARLALQVAPCSSK